MNDLTKLKETYSKKYPHYESYAKCQSKAFMTGMAVFGLSGVSVYLLQEAFHKKLPYNRTSFLLPSVIISSVISYAYTRNRTRACQNMWMVMEDKYSNLPAENHDEVLQNSKG